MTDFTILVVEDDADQVVLLKRAFARANLVNPLKVARDGEEAVSYLSKVLEDGSRGQLPSLVLLDLNLPRRSGSEVLGWIRSEPRLSALPVIVLTSSSDPVDVERAYRLGANSYVVKPVGFDGLLEIVKSIGVSWVVLNQVPNGFPPGGQ
jgi:CheY-like chemotaxis protein